MAEKIVVYDNGSTDNTKEIVKSFPNTELREFDTNNTLDDIDITNLYNNCWKESRGKADFVIMSSVDEFLWSPLWRELLEIYKDRKVDVPVTKGYSMLAENESIYNKLSTYEGQIYDLIKTGAENKNDSKKVIFNPEIEINYKTGCHECEPTGKIGGLTSGFRMLHYSILGLENALRKNVIYRERFSQRNKDLNLGFHRFDDMWYIQNCYQPVKNNLIKVV